jgi:hypothetical protein
MAVSYNLKKTARPVEGAIDTAPTYRLRQREAPQPIFPSMLQQESGIAVFTTGDRIIE